MNKLFPVVIAGCIALFGNASTPPARAEEPTNTASVLSLQNVPLQLRDAKTLNDFSAARKALLGAVASSPDSSNAQYLLAETTRRALRLASTLPATDLSFTTVDAELFNSEEAIRRYSLAIAGDAKNARAYFGRGSLYLERSTPADDARALDDFNKAIALDPKIPEAYLARALAAGRGQNPSLEKLLADYDKAITLGISGKGEDETYEKIIAPRLRGAAYTGRGTIYLEQSRADKTANSKALVEKALSDFNKAIALDPQARSARIQRAGLLVQKGATDEALADLNFVLDKQPGVATALVQRAEIYRRQNQRDKARADVRLALQSNEQLGAWLNNPIYAGIAASIEAQKRGDEWLAQGAFDEALAEYSKAIELDNGNAAAFAGRAAVKMRRSDLTGAQTDLDAGLKLQPDNVKLLTTRGQVFARQGKYAEAMKDLEKATTIAPDDVAAWEQTGIVQQAQGKYSDAERSYDKAIGFAALTMQMPGQPNNSLAAVRRLIVRAAQGIEQTWDSDLEKLPPQKLAAGVQISDIELRKNPESKSLQSLRAAMQARLQASNTF
jgi:tetratricopeptide (TPR) repeat protein